MSIDIIKTNFPDITIKNYEHIKSGFDNDVFIVNDELVFRVPKENENVKTIMKTEMDLLDILSQNITLPIPKYIYRSKDSSFGGYQIVVGKILKRNVLSSLDRNTKDVIIKTLGKFLEELHGHKTDLFTALGYTSDTHYRFEDGYHKYLIQKIDEKYADIFKKDTLQKIYAFINNLKNVKIQHTAFTHFDLNPKNIIYNEKIKNISGIIDFSDAALFDPAIDFAKLLQHYGPTFTKKVVKNYALDFGDIHERAVFYRKMNFIIGLRYHYKRYSGRFDKLEKKVLRMLS